LETRAHPGGSADPALNVRFGPFELDLQGGELRKEGRRIRLQEQPFQILRMLLESPGEVVSREAIRQRLWPDGTVVEFDHSINASVKRLRDALRDSAEKPRYIETVARRGYRFIAELDVAERPAPVTEPAVAPPPPEPIAAAPRNESRSRQEEPAVSRRPLAFGPRVLVPALLAAIILIIWAGARYYRHGGQPLVAAPLQPLMRLDLDLGSDVPPGPQSGANAILSPDGMRLVYRSHSELFMRRLDQAVATELPGTEGAQAPFFSPDGQWVAFSARGILNKVSVQGGPVIALCKDSLSGGGSWGDDGDIVFASEVFLSRVPSMGGAPTRLTEMAPGEISHRWPQILPGSKAVLFSAYTSMTGLDGATIEVQSLRDGGRKTLVRGGTWGRYLPSGHLVYINKGTLFAVPFDLDRLEVSGTATPVLDEVAYSAAWGSAQIDYSAATSGPGTLVYRSSKQGEGLVTIQWLDDSGSTRTIIPVPGNYLSPAVSPDGGRVALISEGDIWVYELGRGSMTRLTFGGGYRNPLWTADGRYIVFGAARGIFWARADGAGQPQALTSSDTQQLPWSFTGDGKRLAFVEPTSTSHAVIWTVAVDSGPSGLRAGKPEVFLQASFNARSPMFSPDGRWIAYQSDEQPGTMGVYVLGFPDKHGKQQISSGAGYPSWSRNRHELFFLKFRAQQNHAQQNQLMVTSYRARGDSFVADPPRLWSQNRFLNFSTTRDYDPAPDGKHVVALMPAETTQEPRDRVIFLLNFFDELRRRVPLNAK
jgi:DNA-binding winged helix-turn-helix (wHTH) protein/Tol biopolymer transport system component